MADGRWPIADCRLPMADCRLPIVVRSVHAAGQPRRPLDEVLLEHLKGLEHAEQSGAAATVRQDIRASITRDTRYGWLNVLDCWPKPDNRWVDGAVQAAKCVCCDKYKVSHKEMREHLQRHMKVDEREKHFRSLNGVWVYNALETKWCVRVQGPVFSKLVPVLAPPPRSAGATATLAAPASVAATPPATVAVPNATFQCCCSRLGLYRAFIEKVLGRIGLEVLKVRKQG